MYIHPVCREHQCECIVKDFNIFIIKDVHYCIFKKFRISTVSEWGSMGTSLKIFQHWHHFFVLNMEDYGALRTLVNYLNNCNIPSINLLDLKVVYWMGIRKKAPTVKNVKLKYLYYMLMDNTFQIHNFSKQCLFYIKISLRKIIIPQIWVADILISSLFYVFTRFRLSFYGYSMWGIWLLNTGFSMVWEFVKHV